MKPPQMDARVFMNCRLCWERIRLQLDRVQVLETGFAYRCQRCDNSFLLRLEDILAIGSDDQPGSSSDP
jgi:hypothetical protein